MVSTIFDTLHRPGGEGGLAVPAPTAPTAPTAARSPKTSYDWLGMMLSFS